MASSIDFDFRNKLLKMHGALSLTYCYQCGTCSGGCPVAKETNGKYNPRRIIEKSLLGMKDKLVKDPVLWFCTLCDTCDESCPQHVELTEIFYVLKNLAVKEGFVPDAYKAQSMAVFDNGVAVPYMAPMIRARKELGLEQNLEENIVIPVKELQTLMEATGMKEIVEKFKAEKAAAAPTAKPSE
nr:4Fe-4S dicluster domain-containing protein [Candidatus Sigynarchaeum springense]MDO8116208.1 4Fe-4S dicluster domain-containing protein [Candidatus Sigynarchaeota archaeon]